MMKKLKLSNQIARYMGALSLVVASMALNTYCYGILGEPELPKMNEDIK